jgi:uncharacterized membrane protein YdbT with pleckstrin-like domain
MDACSASDDVFSLVHATTREFTCTDGIIISGRLSRLRRVQMRAIGRSAGMCDVTVRVGRSWVGRKPRGDFRGHQARESDKEKEEKQKNKKEKKKKKKKEKKKQNNNNRYGETLEEEESSKSRAKRPDNPRLCAKRSEVEGLVVVVDLPPLSSMERGGREKKGNKLGLG